MTTQELVNAVILKATGKAKILSSSDSKYQKILGIANAYIDTWQYEMGVDWASLYNPEHSIGLVTETDSFDLGDEVRKISSTLGDPVRVRKDNRDIEFDVVSADELNRYSDENICARIGEQLVFKSAFTEDSPLLGGEILVPCYTYAPHLVNPSDEIPVDIPRWLVVISAADYVRNDVTKMSQYPNLVNEANVLMERMRDDNDGQRSNVYATWRPSGRSF